MAKSILFFMLFLLVPFAEAKEQALPMPLNVDYIKDLSRPSKLPAAVDQVFKKHALEKLIGRDGEAPVNSLDLMSRIYLSRTYGTLDKKVALVMSGLEIPESIQTGVIYSHESVRFLHFRSGEGQFAVFLKGFDEAATLAIAKDVNQALAPKSAHKPSARFLFAQGLIARKANAAEDNRALCGAEIPTSPNAKPTSESSKLKNTWECTKGLAGGMWDATGGAAWSIAKGTYNAVVHPIDTANAALNGIENVRKMMSDLSGSFSQLSKSYDSLPEEVKVKIGCEVIGSVGASVAVTWLTAGAGSPLVAAKIAQAITKVGQALPKGSAAAAKTLALGEQATARVASAQAIRGFIAQGPEGAEYVKKLTQFDKTITDVNKAHTDLSYASRVPKHNSGGKIIDTISEEARFRKAVAVRDAASEADPKFWKALSDVRHVNRNEYLLDKDLRAKVLAELAKNQKLTVAERAAAVAYVTAAACNTNSEVAGAAAGARKSGPAQR